MEKRNAIKFVSVLLFCAVLSSVSFAEPWTFIAVGDSRGSDNGVNTTILGELATEIVNQDVDFVLFPGDLVNGGVNQTVLEGQLRTWMNTMQPVYANDINVYAVRGNHDVGSPSGVTAWNNVFSDSNAFPGNGPSGEVNLTYSFTHNNAFIVGLDEYITTRRVNQTWLDTQFAANSQPHVFVFGHEPAFKVYHADCLDDYSANRDAFWVSIKNAGGRTYFCGHDHFYNHAVVNDGDGNPSNDIHQYLVGSAGAPLYTWLGNYDGVNSGYGVENIHHAKQYGYTIWEINGLDVTMIWMERIGVGTYVVREVWSYTVLRSDLNGDGVVDFKDFAALAVRWRDSGCGVCGGADLSGDEQVEFDDLWWFTENWPDSYRKQASGPVPDNNAMDINLDVVLNWIADGYASHDVYFGTSDPPALQGNQAGTSFDPCGLEYVTNYYWKINEVYPDSDVIEGETWNFTTAAEPNSYLVGWWEFEEGAGADANDSAGNSDGTLMGNPSWVPGKIGNYALDFDGVGDYVEIPHNDNLSLVSGGTVSAWINLNNTNLQGIVTKQPSGTDGNYYLILAAGKMNFTITTGIWAQRVAATDPTVCPTGQWVLYTGTFDASFVKLYKNGVEVDSEPHIITPSASTANVNIGHWALIPTNFANGVIDDVRIYNRALSANEVLELYQSGAN